MEIEAAVINMTVSPVAECDVSSNPGCSASGRPSTRHLYGDRRQEGDPAAVHHPLACGSRWRDRHCAGGAQRAGVKACHAMSSWHLASMDASLELPGGRIDRAVQRSCLSQNASFSLRAPCGRLSCRPWFNGQMSAPVLPAAPTLTGVVPPGHRGTLCSRRC